MATAQTLLNNVLRGLRRDIVNATSTTDAYHILLLQFLNSAKEELEDTWDWQALRTTVTVTIAASQVAYTLTASGDADVDVGPRSRLLYERPARVASDAFSLETTDWIQGSLPQVFDVTDSSEYRLDEISPEEMERLHFTDNNETANPSCFCLYKDASSVLMKVWPTPSATRTCKMRFVIPQAGIPYSYMSSYSLSIPERPVWLKALVSAAEERGEDVGRPLSSLNRDAENALYLALARERLDVQDNTSYPV